MLKKEELTVLNEQARELKRKGDFEGIRNLCKEKGISDEMVDDFILGDVLYLDDTKVVNTPEEKTTEVSNVEIIVPFYRSIEEKLETESEELLKNVKEDREKAVIKAQLKPIIDYILSDDDMKAKAFRDWKELGRCYKHMTDKARQFAINGVACIGDSTVFDWIREYYDLDDQQEVAEERLKKAIAEKKAAEAKAKEKEKKPKKPRKTKAEKEAEAKEVTETSDAEVENKVGETENAAQEEPKQEMMEFVIDESLVSEETVNASH